MTMSSEQQREFYALCQEYRMIPFSNYVQVRDSYDRLCNFVNHAIEHAHAVKPSKKYKVSASLCCAAPRRCRFLTQDVRDSICHYHEAMMDERKKTRDE